MPSYRKQRKTYRKRPYTASTKRIAKIAKSVVKRTLENHQSVTLWEPTWFDNGGANGSNSQWFPISYTVGNGTDDKSFTGSSIMVTEISAKMFAYTSSTIGGVDQDATFRVSLVATDQVLTLAGNPGVLENYGYQYGQNTNPVFMHFNPQTVTVLRDFKFQLKGNEGTNPHKIVNWQKRFKKGLKLTFLPETETPNSLKGTKGKNYYLVFSFYKPNASLSAGVVGGVRAQMKIKYKDI